MRALSFLCFLFLASDAMAQDYTGTYAVSTSNGRITLTLEQQGSQVTGTLVDENGRTYRLTGGVDDEGALVAELTNEAGMAALGAMLDGPLLVVHLIPFDAGGQPIYAATTEVEMQRTEADTAARPGGPLGQSTAAPFTGTYTGHLSGTPTTLTLRQEGMTLHGEADAGGYRYTLQATPSGDTAEGTLTDPQTGGTMGFELAAQGDGLTLTLLVPNPNTGTVERVPASFQPGIAGQPAPPPGIDPNTERDQRLTGTWSYQEVITGGGQSIATQLLMYINGDGTFVQGDARTLGGGEGWSGQVSGGGDVTRGEWRTEHGVFYIRAPEMGVAQWVPAARYELAAAGDRVLLIRNDGSKELWYRQ